MKYKVIARKKNTSEVFKKKAWKNNAQKANRMANANLYLS